MDMPMAGKKLPPTAQVPKGSRFVVRVASQPQQNPGYGQIAAFRLLCLLASFNLHLHPRSDRLGTGWMNERRESNR